MASSGVWEIVILGKTPTLDGVCQILFFTILILFHIIMPNVGIFASIANSLMLVVTDVIVTILVVNHLDVIGRCFLSCG